eukprot:scpid109795/ scgid15082/ 
MDQRFHDFGRWAFPGSVRYPDATPLDVGLFGFPVRAGRTSFADWIHVNVQRPIANGFQGVIFEARIPGDEITITRSVIKARHNNGKPEVAKSITNEVQILMRLCHPNIVMFYGAMQ